VAEAPERTASGPSRPSDFTRVGQGAASFLISTGIGMASSLARTILLARTLGVGRYGALTLAFASSPRSVRPDRRCPQEGGPGDG
jgi:hypothetical protein